MRLLEVYGDGTTAPCTHCGIPLDYNAIQNDRIEEGGSYSWENVVPSCHKCNINRYQGLAISEREEKKEVEAAMRAWADKKRTERSPIKIRKNPRRRLKPAKRIHKSKAKIYRKRRSR